MTRKSCTTWVLLMGTVYHCVLAGRRCSPLEKRFISCMKTGSIVVIQDKFTGFITAKKHFKSTADACIVFLKDAVNKMCGVWPQMQMKNGTNLLYLSIWHIKRNSTIYILKGEDCKAEVKGPQCSPADASSSCKVKCFHAKTTCRQAAYDERNCKTKQLKNRYIINLTTTSEDCHNCNNPVKKPDREVSLKNNDAVKDGKVDPGQATMIMNGMAKFASEYNESSIAVSLGEEITGIIVKETHLEDAEEVSFAYESPNDPLSIIDDSANLAYFSRSVTVTKEAFEKATVSNPSEPFVAVFRVLNLGQDELNSTVLGNEILTVEMGANIRNLTDKININFWNMKYSGVPTCHSWNGEGSRPNWTTDGCQTVKNTNNITCQCSHLTFFAILLTPLNETITSSDLNNLNIITQVGCGMSIFFLCIVLFMHFFLRKTKGTKSTRILIHLVAAMLLLNLSFLVNSSVAKLQSSVGCKVMAALTHYSMLATFTWFAVQAFHVSLQVYTGGRIVIRRYILKVSVVSWVSPSIVGIVLLATGKYGEQVLHADDSADDVTMCWITDSDAHLAVNIGYYALVFLFTFTTFIVIVSWLICLRRINGGSPQVNRNGISIATVFGLCCLLGITWGFAFLAYGALRIPSYYIFTVLNSFQGFFLFVYYYFRKSGDTNAGASVKNSTSTSGSSTLATGLDIFDNPYSNLPHKT